MNMILIHLLILLGTAIILLGIGAVFGILALIDWAEFLNREEE